MKNRQRGRNGGKPRPMGGGGGGRNPNFDGNAGRPRGNAQQLMEKFLAMARDATSAGDRVLAENYFQHADHYYRVLNARFEQQNGQGGQHQQGQNNNGQGHGQRPQGNDDNRGNQMDRQDDYNQNRRYDNNPGNYGQQEAQAPQPAPQAQPAPPQPQPQPQPPRQPEGDIGLPPGILGIAPAATATAAADDKDEGEDRTRPPQGTRRRRGGRSAADAGE